MSEQKGYLEESSGKKSSMRLMSFLSFVSANIFGIMAILRPGPDGLYICIAFLLGAFAPKAVQKFAETTAATKGSQ